MSQRRLSMRKIRELLRLKYELGRSHRDFAASLGIANSTVSGYVRLSGNTFTQNSSIGRLRSSAPMTGRSRNPITPATSRRLRCPTRSVSELMRVQTHQREPDVLWRSGGIHETRRAGGHSGGPVLERASVYPTVRQRSWGLGARRP